MNSGEHYFFGLCNACKQPPPRNTTLKGCDKCQMVFYCNREHQDQDRSKHEQLCNFIVKSGGQEGLRLCRIEGDCNLSNWQQVRMESMQKAEAALKRPLSTAEREIFLFPPICEVCGTHGEDLRTCNSCQSTAFCCRAHLEIIFDTHLRWCPWLKNAIDCIGCSIPDSSRPAIPLNHVPPHVPMSPQEPLVAFPKSMVSLLTGKNGCGPVDPQLALISEGLSFSLTLLHVLHKTGVNQGKALVKAEELTVHVIGAEDPTECGVNVRWEDTFHYLPCLKTLNLIFIGPTLHSDLPLKMEIPMGTICKECYQEGRELNMEFLRMPYHAYVQGGKREESLKANNQVSPSTSNEESQDLGEPEVKGDSPVENNWKVHTPDVLVAYNCGFSDRDSPWGPTLPLLLGWNSTPLILTGYSIGEMMQDLIGLQRHCQGEVQVLITPHQNPFRSLRPVRDWLKEDGIPVFFLNSHYAVVCKPQ